MYPIQFANPYRPIKQKHQNSSFHSRSRPTHRHIYLTFHLSCSDRKTQNSLRGLASQHSGYINTPQPCIKTKGLAFSSLFLSESQSLEKGGFFYQLVSHNRLANYMVELDDQIPTIFDPFADDKDSDAAGTKDYVHIRVQQRNGRKCLTTVQGLKKEFSYEKILKDVKKEFCCNGNVVQDKELGKVIQLQGDQRKNVSGFLVKAGIVKKEQIKVHGF